MEFFGVCEISLRPSEISDGKKEKNLYWWAKTGVRAQMECFSKQISWSEILSDILFTRRKKKRGENAWNVWNCLNFRSFWKKCSYLFWIIFMNTEAHGLKKVNLVVDHCEFSLQWKAEEVFRTSLWLGLFPCCVSNQRNRNPKTYAG